MLKNPNEWHNIENESKGVEENLITNDVQGSETLGMPKNNIKRISLLVIILLLLVSASVYKVSAIAASKNSNLAESFFNPENPILEEETVEEKKESTNNLSSTESPSNNSDEKISTNEQKNNSEVKEIAIIESEIKKNKPNIISKIQSFFNKNDNNEDMVSIEVQIENNEESKAQNTSKDFAPLQNQNTETKKEENNNSEITETFFEPEEIVVKKEEAKEPPKQELAVEKQEEIPKEETQSKLLVSKAKEKKEIKKNNDLEQIINSFLIKLGLTSKKEEKTLVESKPKDKTKTQTASLEKDKVETKTKEEEKTKISQLKNEEPTVVIEVDFNKVKANENIKVEKVIKKKKNSSTENRIVTVKIGEVGRDNPFKPSIQSGIGFDIITPPTSSIGDATANRLMKTTISGIMYDDKRPSAIINIDGEDQLVRKGDKVLGCTVLNITREKVVVKSGTNIYRASVGQSITTDTVHINQVANLKSKFAGANNPNIKSIEIKPN